MMRYLVGVMGGLALLAAAPALAEGCASIADPIGTDRPDITDTPTVPPPGSLQVEGGLDYSRQGSDRAWQAPSVLLRAGIAECTEFALEVPTYVYARGGGHSGFSDVTPSIKREFTDIAGLDTAVVFGIGLPTGSSEISGRGVNPYLQFIAAKDLPAGWSLAGMLTGYSYPDQREGDQGGQISLSLGKEIAEGAQLFFEIAADGQKNEGAVLQMDTGGTFRLSELDQLDFRVGWGLNRNSPDFFFGLGYSIRFDGLLRFAVK